MMRERRAIFLTVLMALFVFATTTTSDRQVFAAPTWTARATDANRNWITLFASDDGTKLIGTVENGKLMRSTDSGVTWTEVTSLGDQNWYGVFGTPDGQKVMATVARGPVFLSNDYGVTWTRLTSLGERWWSDGAMSADGQQIMFVGNADVPNGDPDVGYIYRSTNGGSTWTLTNMARYPSSATMSRDGRYRAFGEYSLKLYTSSDFGVTWTVRDSGADRYYTELTSSDSGQYMYAATLYDKVLRSTDYGVTWSQLSVLPHQTYRNVRTSSDGKRVIASAQDGFVYASDDYGVTWTSAWDDAQRNWFASAMSRDGSKTFIAKYGGHAYSSSFFGVAVSAPAAVTATASYGLRKSIDVSWQSVTNAGSYTLNLYDSSGSTQLATISGISPGLTSRTITTSDYANLDDNTSYRVSVRTEGTATQYGGVTESSAVAVTTNLSTVTTSTSSTTTSSTTTVPQTTSPSTTVTTAAPATTVAPLNAVSVTTVAIGQKDIATVSPTSVVQNAVSTSTSSTTIAPLVSANSGASSTEVSAPEAPSVSPGEVSALVDGELVEGLVTRENNALVASVGTITATITGVSPDGQRISLDSDGNLRLEENDFIQVEAEGYGSGESVDVWMYSTPTRIGSTTASVDGKISARFELPKNLEVGNHRVVLNGLNKEGTPVVLGIGLKFGAQPTTSTTTRVLIAIPIALAVAAGFILPTTIRRRRRAAA